MRLARVATIVAVVFWSMTGMAKTVEYDVVVYGGTPGGITAAIAVAREGGSVILLEQTRHVGGLNTSGLNRDEGEHMDRRTLNGLYEMFSREAARRSGARVNPKGPRMWHSHIAEDVFLEMIEQAGVKVRYEQLIENVKKDKTNITELRGRGGSVYRAKVFIDATYEGDLMAAAGVSYTVGREGRDEYNESLAGVRYMDKKIKSSPYDDNGNLLPGIIPGKPPAEFTASPIPICYNIRLNLSTDPKNQVPIEKPQEYNPWQYELLARSFESGKLKGARLKGAKQILGLYVLPGRKRECNNRQYSVISMSIPGAQTAWAEASFEERDAIHEKYRTYTHGLLWFLKTDKRVPESIRNEMAQYGFCRDEWQDNDHWPWYLYIRAARRMKGRYIMTQHDIIDNLDKEDVIHIGSHFIDSHHVTRYAFDKDHFINEGRIWQKSKNFDIPYRAITPKSEECENLLVPVCVSASNVAFAAIRLEPTWMHLGEAAGIAAVMAAKNRSTVQAVDVGKLQACLRQLSIPLEVPESQPMTDAKSTIVLSAVEKPSVGGFVVVSGCSDTGFIEGFGLKGRIVQAMDTDSAAIEKVRRQLHAKKLYGALSARRFDGKHLPYIDNLVNLYVKLESFEVTDDEIRRVLTPGGRAINAEGKTLFAKNRPVEMDE